MTEVLATYLGVEVATIVVTLATLVILIPIIYFIKKPAIDHMFFINEKDS